MLNYTLLGRLWVDLIKWVSNVRTSVCLSMCPHVLSNSNSKLPSQNEISELVQCLCVESWYDIVDLCRFTVSVICWNWVTKGRGRRLNFSCDMTRFVSWRVWCLSYRNLYHLSSEVLLRNKWRTKMRNCWRKWVKWQIRGKPAINLLGSSPLSDSGVSSVLKGVIVSSIRGMGFQADVHCGDVTFALFYDKQVIKCRAVAEYQLAPLPDCNQTATWL